MITLEDYLGPFEASPAATPTLRARASLLLEKVNKLLVLAKLGGVVLTPHPRTKTLVSSGLRPPDYNAGVPGASPTSLHMKGGAVDLYDPAAEIDNWLQSPSGTQAMVDLGLWAEHPASTKGWSHLQDVAPRSGNRFFYP